MNPCADLSIPADTPSVSQQQEVPPPLPSRRNHESYSDPNLEDTFNDSLSDNYEDDYEMSVYVDDDMDDMDDMELNRTENVVSDRQWRYEDEPYYDDIFHDEEYIEDHFNSDEDDSSVSSASNVNCFYRGQESNTVYSNDEVHFASASTTTRS